MKHQCDSRVDSKSLFASQKHTIELDNRQLETPELKKYVLFFSD